MNAVRFLARFCYRFSGGSVHGLGSRTIRVVFDPISRVPCRSSNSNSSSKNGSNSSSTTSRNSSSSNISSSIQSSSNGSSRKNSNGTSSNYSSSNNSRFSLGDADGCVV